MCLTLHQEKCASGSGDSAFQYVVVTSGLGALHADEGGHHAERASHHCRDHKSAGRLDITCGKQTDLDYYYISLQYQ